MIAYLSHHRRVLAVLLVGSLWAGVRPGMAFGQSSSYPKGVRIGDAVIVQGGSLHSPRIGQGGSKTLFSLELPRGSSCPGDSANDGFRVQGFMVPAIDDPGKLRYKSIQPEGTGRWGLFDEHTTSYAQMFTAKRDKPGGPGLLLEIPRFTLSVFPPGMVQPGNYRIGIACTLYNETITYWDSALSITSDAADKPSGLHWKVPGFEDLDPGSGGNSFPVVGWVVSLLALVAICVGIVGVLQRRRGQTPTDTGS